MGKMPRHCCPLQVEESKNRNTLPFKTRRALFTGCATPGNKLKILQRPLIQKSTFFFLVFSHKIRKNSSQRKQNHYVKRKYPRVTESVCAISCLLIIQAVCPMLGIPTVRWPLGARGPPGTGAH